MKKILFASLLSVLLATSCKKSDSVDPIVIPNFMTYTVGSTWDYERIDNNASTTTLYTITSTNRDSSFLGRTFHVFTNSNGPAQYMYKVDNNYFNYESIPSFIGGNGRPNRYLVADLANAEIWVQTFPIIYGGIPRTLEITNTIVGKNLTKVVNGITYTGVTQVRTNFIIQDIPPTILTTNIVSDYAPQVGLIEKTSNITLTIIGFPPSNENITVRLKAATIQ